MLQFLDAPYHLLALKIDGGLNSDEMLDICKRLDQSLDSQPRTDVFVEVSNFSHFPNSVIAQYLPYALRWLRSLELLGRVAVVADAACIRWAASIEGALLPHVEYKSLAPTERADAWDWVVRKADGMVESS